MAGNTSTPGGTVTGRVVAILHAFDRRHRELRLTEIARRADLSLPTTHRLTRELCAGGLLARRDDGVFVIGRQLWDLGLLAPAQTGLRETASPFLHDIFAATFATVHVAVRDGKTALYLDRLSGHASVPVVSKIGARLPLHATGVGKILLAYAPEDLQAAALGVVVASLRRDRARLAAALEVAAQGIHRMLAQSCVQ